MVIAWISLQANRKTGLCEVRFYFIISCMKPLASLLPKLTIKSQQLSFDNDADYLVELYNDPGGRCWYSLASSQLGRRLVRQLASMSKTGRDPKRLFTYLARKAINDKTAAATKY